MISLGSPCTIMMYSDRYAATVIKVTKTTVVVQRDKATRTDTNGWSEQQSYTYTRDENGPKFRFRLRKDGQYHGKGCWLSIGERSEYWDPGF